MVRGGGQVREDSLAAALWMDGTERAPRIVYVYVHMHVVCVATHVGVGDEEVEEAVDDGHGGEPRQLHLLHLRLLFFLFVCEVKEGYFFGRWAFIYLCVRTAVSPYIQKRTHQIHTCT